MSGILFALAVLAGLGILFGAVLAVAGKVFAVEEDPRLEPLTEALPGANCGGCGFSGCGAYAAAVIAGTAAPGGCPVGGEAVAKAMAEIMGVSVDENARRKVALVHCTGHCKEHQVYDYDGISDCLAASRLPSSSPYACKNGCLGFGSCEKACPFDAIHVIDGTAIVDEEKCKGCSKCVAACPKGLISLVPADRAITIPCRNTDKGPVARKACSTACIGCGLCVKNCPAEAIKLENFHAIVDHNKCTGCGTCASKCPQKIIHLSAGIASVEPAVEA